MFPDKPEMRRASQLFKAALDSVTKYLIMDLNLCFSLVYIEIDMGSGAEGVKEGNCLPSILKIYM